LRKHHFLLFPKETVHAVLYIACTVKLIMEESRLLLSNVSKLGISPNASIIGSSKGTIKRHQT